MGSVAAWPRHLLHGPQHHAPTADRYADMDEVDRCPCCAGGLAYCTVCSGAEASLPTDCPGRQLTEAEQDGIAAGTLDYVRGHWLQPERRHRE